MFAQAATIGDERDEVKCRGCVDDGGVLADEEDAKTAR